MFVIYGEQEITNKSNNKSNTLLFGSNINLTISNEDWTMFLFCKTSKNYPKLRKFLIHFHLTIDQFFVLFLTIIKNSLIKNEENVL